MEVPYESRPYRKNVAAVVLDTAGRILCCRRRDFQDAWQLPQGGLDDGEAAEAGLLRELEEEIGTKEVEIIGRLREPIRYDWPAEVAHRHYRGQEQIYFLVRALPSAAIDFDKQPSAEFDACEWLRLPEFLARLDQSSKGGFKYAAYVEALEKLDRQFPGLMLK